MGECLKIRSARRAVKYQKLRHKSRTSNVLSIEASKVRGKPTTLK